MSAWSYADSGCGHPVRIEQTILTGVPLDEVPHFVDPATVDANGWLYMVAGWLTMDVGCHLSDVNSAEWKACLAAGKPMPGKFLVAGRSPRGIAHMVAYHDATMIDPHPSQDGLESITNVWCIS